MDRRCLCAKNITANHGEAMIGSLFTDVRKALNLSKRALEREYRAHGYEICHQVFTKWERGEGNPCKVEYLAPLFEIYEDLAAIHNETADLPLPTTIHPHWIGTALIRGLDKR